MWIPGFLFYFELIVQKKVNFKSVLFNFFHAFKLFLKFSWSCLFD
jgi:hypothetical protein